MDTAASRRGLTTLRTYIPDVARVCYWIDGDSPEEKARELSNRLLPVLGRAGRAAVAVS
jgi:hypothetical protein